MKNLKFFIGKGGVGKSTVSALTAICLAKKNNKVLLVSLDPAHNLSDILKKKLSDKKKKIYKELCVTEVDEKKEVKKYLKKIEVELKKTYSYQTAFSMDKYFNLIKFSPGIEEYSILQVFKEIIDKSKNFDFIIFDMPPTALTLKFFRLPGLSKLWLLKLKELREKIIEKKGIISKINFGEKKIELDKITNKIDSMICEHNLYEEIFKNSSDINVIINDDSLSISEFNLIERSLSEIGISWKNVILNRFHGESLKILSNKWNIIKLIKSEVPLIGVDRLIDFTKLNYIEMEKIL